MQGGARDRGEMRGTGNIEGGIRDEGILAGLRYAHFNWWDAG